MSSVSSKVENPPVSVARKPGNGWVAAAAASASWRADLLSVLSYAILTVVFLRGVAVGGLVPLGFDLFSYFYPYKAYLAEMVRQGQLPLWNPMIFMGAPLLANIQTAVFYPPDLLFYLLSTADALRYSVLLHVFLAATLTFCFARVSMRLSVLAAWIAGAVFGFGGFIGAQVGHLNQLHAAVWLPLLMLALERAGARRSWRIALLGGLALACQILAGHTQQVYYSGIVLLLFALYLTFSMGADGVLSGRERLWPVAALAIMGVTAGGAAAVQLIPTLELTRESYRSGGIPFSEAITYSVKIPDLLDSILPQYGSTPYVEVTGHTGVIALLLVPSAMAWKRWYSMPSFLLGLGGAALAISLGDGTPLYRILYGLVPGFDLFRAPGRWLFVYSLCVALLAGSGVDSLRSALSGDIRRWVRRYALTLVGGAVCLVLLNLWMGTMEKEFSLPHGRIVLAWSLYSLMTIALSLLLVTIPRSWLVRSALAALVIFESFQASAPLEYNKPVYAAVYSDPRPLFDSVVPGSGYRALSLMSEKPVLADEGTLRATVLAGFGRDDVARLLDYIRSKELLSPNISMGFGIPTLDGYDGGVLPTKRYARLKQVLMGSESYKPDLTMLAERGESRTVPDSRLLGAFGVSRLLANRSVEGLDSGWKVSAQASGASPLLLDNVAAVPRAHLVHSMAVFSDDARLLEAVRGEDLTKTVLLSEPVTFQPAGPSGPDEVAIEVDRANQVALRTKSDAPGFLLLADSYYPGWKVFVDGQEKPLLRADYAVRAVQLSAGDHQVRFVYQPMSVAIGAAISMLSLLVVGILLFFDVGRLRRPRAA